MRNRTRPTLETITQRWILPGTKIFSDAWAAYGQLQSRSLRPAGPSRYSHAECGVYVGNMKAINEVPVWHIKGSHSHLPEAIYLGE